MQSLVYKTLTHKDYHFDFLPPNNPENWVSTGIAMAVNSLRKAPLSDKMLAVCCQTSLREDQSEAVVRVVVLDYDLKVSSKSFSPFILLIKVCLPLIKKKKKTGGPQKVCETNC